MKSDYVNFMNSDQIDSLRILLEVKEKHLCRIMEAVQSWEDVDSFIVNEFPIIANQSIKFKTITYNKKGLAGLFGKKETVKVPFYSDGMIDLNRDIPKIRKFKATNSLRVSCLFCIFKHSSQKTV